MFINNFNPVAIQIFSIEIRWYSLAYIFGILIGWLYCKKILIKDKNISKLFDDLISYLIIGIILGGRLGYVIFYNLEYFSSNPIEILMIWQGGMSFHGGLLGVLASTIIYAKKHNVNKFIFLDLIAGSAPIGIFLGRIANLVNKANEGNTYVSMQDIANEYYKNINYLPHYKKNNSPQIPQPQTAQIALETSEMDRYGLHLA